MDTRLINHLLNTLHGLLQRPQRLLVIASDGLIIAGAYYVANYLRFEGEIPLRYIQLYELNLPFLILISLLCLLFFGAYSGVWWYASLNDLFSVLKGNTIGVLINALFLFIVNIRIHPRSIYVIHWFVSIAGICAVRLGLRYLRDYGVPRPVDRVAPARNVLLVGADDAGEALLRGLQSNYREELLPIGFLDIDKDKKGLKIHGVPVLGTVDEFESILDGMQVEEVIFASPALDDQTILGIASRCYQRGIPCKKIPSLPDILDGKFEKGLFKDINFEAILNRQTLKLHDAHISDHVRDKCVLVTGAGGSIGSELCKQIIRFHPSRLILFERGENNLFLLENELRDLFPSEFLVPMLGDINEESHLERCFTQYRPQIVFHAAAYKHVPMVEHNPAEGIRNNVLGTRKLALHADRNGVESFIMISTDKAVNPTSIMGASKRMAELNLLGLSKKSSTKFVIVRFGNIIGSSGSVIPIFRRQLERGEPLTITDPEMARYFMTPEEAVQLVILAGSIGKGGEIFVLNMGDPIRITDLARNFSILSGKDPSHENATTIIGPREGEKLSEALFYEDEVVLPTEHEAIWRVEPIGVDFHEINRTIDEMHHLANNGNREQLFEKIHQWIPSYEPWEQVIENRQEEDPRALSLIRVMDR